MDVTLANELGKRYTNTYTCLKLNNKLVPVFIDNIVIEEADEEGRERQIDVFYYAERGGTQKSIDINSFYEALLPIAHAKLFTHQGTLMYYYRVPHRQYRKGYCSDNTKVIDIVAHYVGQLLNSSIEYQSMLNVTPSYNQEMFGALHNDNYTFSLEDAIQSCELGIAISEEWGITISCNVKYDFIIWRYGQMVGGLKGNNIVTFAFNQEVKDFIVRFSNTNYEVIHEGI